MRMEGTKTRRPNANTRTSTFFTLLTSVLKKINTLLNSCLDRKVDPNRYVLRNFRVLHTSTHRDGESVPETGFYHEHVLYELRVVYTGSCTYVHGEIASFEEYGDPALQFLAHVARVYLDVMRLAEQQRGGRILENSHPVVECTPAERNVLTRHRDYLRLRKYWLDRGYHLSLSEVSHLHTRVFLKKIHQGGAKPHTNVRHRARIDII